MANDKNPYAEPDHNVMNEMYDKIKGLFGNQQTQVNPYAEPDHSLSTEIYNNISGLFGSKNPYADMDNTNPMFKLMRGLTGLLSPTSNNKALKGTGLDNLNDEQLKRYNEIKSYFNIKDEPPLSPNFKKQLEDELNRLPITPISGGTGFRG
jgi:hypothetical protein